MAEVKPRCRLYLQLPGEPTPKLEAQLSQVLAAADAACVLLSGDGNAIDEQHVDRLIDLVQHADAACLLDGDAELAMRLGTDGVHLPPDVELYRTARSLLGSEASIGVGCGLMRHEAMHLAELGADYVGFAPYSPSDIDSIDQCAELIAWWAEIFVVPCIAFDIDTVDQAERFASLGADFVAPSKRIWQTDDGVDRIAKIASAISRARRAA